MKFSLAAAAILLLPLSALASPVAAPVAAPVPAFDDSLTAAPAPVNDDMSTPTQPRAPVISYLPTTCKIVNVSTYANCRTGPGTNYPTKFTVTGGSSYDFDCYKRGTCVDGNCTWDRLWRNGQYCFVSGSLTDSRCNISRLPVCGS